LSQALPKPLIKAGESDPVVLDHLAIAPCAADLGIGKVSEDLDHRPFAWRWALAKLRGWNALY
jgi:hypothetical protein